MTSRKGHVKQETMNVHARTLSEPTADLSCAGITAVIAAYNEGDTIESVISGVRRHTPCLVEIIVVDDGSSDDTAERATKAGAMVRRMDRNHGKGAAMRRGLDHVTTGMVLTIDADGQDDPSEIPSLVKQMEPHIDMVIGSRFLGTFHEDAIEPVNKFGNKALTWFFDKLFGVELTDTQAGFRLFRTVALKSVMLRAEAYEIETELTARVLAEGGRVVEVPVSRYARGAGVTSFRKIYHGMRILKTMIAIRMERGRS